MSSGKPSRIVHALILCALALLFGTVPARATNITAQLIAEANPAPGGSTTIAIVFNPQPGWHGYWKNPGDAGQPARFEWQMPDGVAVEAPRYPVPEKLIIAKLMNHVYNGEHALLARLNVPANAKAGTVVPLRLKAEWLACTNEICVPEAGDLALDIKIGDGRVDAPRRAQFDGWHARLPQPLAQPARFNVTADGVRFAIPYPASAPVSQPWLYAETEDALNYAAPQRISRSGDWLIVEAGKPEYPADLSQIMGLLSLGEGRGLEFRAVPGDVPAAGDPIGEAAPANSAWRTTLLAFGGALLGGFLLNILPCVFPIISLKALSLVRSGESEAAARREALAYTAGVVLTCMALGGLLLGLRAGGVAVGWAFQLQNPWIVALLLLLAVALTANLAGWFTVPGFGGGDALAGQGGTRGAFWTGALAAFVATPCTGPFMAAALGAALVLPTTAALLIFAGLGLGMALPFLALGYVPALRTRMPKPGVWMESFRKWLAVPMGLTALALAWLLAQQAGVLKPSAMALVSAEQGVAFDEAKLASWRQQGQPVFLYFTADWCLTCKVNEKTAIQTDGVQAHFRAAGIKVMVGDWTRGDPAITRFLESHQRSGVPLYLWYAKGAAKPVELPQLLTAGTLTAL